MNLETRRLPSGLTLVVETVPESAVAGLALVVEAGSSRDPRGKEGLSHWVEHLAFRARHGEAASVSRRLDAESASWNGFTSHDLVGYYAFASKTQFPQLVKILSGIMMAPLEGIAPEVYEHERRVVEAERSVRSDHARSQVSSWMFQEVFASRHPYGRPVGGFPVSISRLLPSDASAFVTAYYQPARMTLYAFAPPDVGARAELERSLEPRLTQAAESVAAIREHPGWDTGFEEPGTLARQTAEVAVPELWLAWPMAASNRDERARAEMMADVLSYGAAPRFESDRSIADGNCWLERGRVSGLLVCRISLNDASDVSGTTDRVLTQLREAVAGESTTSFWWMKRHFVLARTLAEERPESRALEFAMNAHQYGSPLETRQLQARVSALEPADISTPGFKLMDRRYTYMMLVEPLAGGVAAADQPTGFATPLPDVDGKESRDTDAQAALARVPARGLSRSEWFKLENGLEVGLLSRRVPFVTALLGFRGGRGWASDPRLGRAAELGEVWKVEPDPVTWGVQLNRWREPDYHAQAARAVSGKLDKVLEILSTSRSAFIEWPSNDFRRMAPALERADGEPRAVAQRETRKLLFDAHPYAGHAPIAGLDGVRFQALRSFSNAIHRPDNGVLIVVGDVDLPALREAARAWFGAWRAPGPASLKLPALSLSPSGLPPRVVLTHRPSATQAELELSCLIPQPDQAAHAAARVLAGALAERARDELRGKTGSAYYVAASVDELAAKASRLVLGTSVAQRHTLEALRFFAGLLQDPAFSLTEAEVAEVRWQALRGLPLASNTTLETAHDLFDAWRLEVPVAALDGYSTRLAETTAARVESAFSGCRGRLVLKLVGDEKLLRQASASVGLRLPNVSWDSAASSGR